jgi:uncharacterized protein (DUF885 family)
MATVYKKGMVASLPGGMKVVQYQVHNTTTTKGDTIDAKDIGLSTICQLSVSAAEAIAVNVGIGTYTPGKGDGNYATLRAYNIAGTVTVAMGTVQILAVGI